ncbi:MAG: hypothetical protein LBM65_01405 [Oscillospiraceae bacterium]|jgi:hypothetical protein|nr:hypothetical protein [Oscillospiraceae bacterium]
MSLRNVTSSEKYAGRTFGNAVHFSRKAQAGDRKVELIKKRMKLKTLILLLFVSFFAVTTAGMAWFTLSSFSAVNTLEMSIGTGSDLLVATENFGTDTTRYSKEITSQMINAQLAQYNVTLEDMLLDPLTSSNGTSFATEAGGIKTANEGFLEFKLYFIATKEMYVHISSDSSTAEANDGTSFTTTSTGNAANVTSAVRLAFDSADGVKILEPNRGTAVAGQSTFELPTPMAYSGTTRLFHLPELTPVEVTFRLWVEGEDPQCNNDIQRANMRVNLNFRGTDENNQAL